MLWRRGVLKKRERTGPGMMRGPVWGGRQAAGKADSQAFSGKRLPHRWLGSWPTKPVQGSTRYIGVLSYHRFQKFCSIRNCDARGRTELDLALRATGRAPSRTPLSQSASALLNVKAFNLSIKVHQNCALPTVDLPSCLCPALTQNARRCAAAA